MTVSINHEGRGALTYDIVGVASTGNAGQGVIPNPEGVTCIIMRASLYNITASTGASNISIGVTTVAAAATDLINALDLNAVAALSIYNCHARQNTAKTDISAPADWTAAKYITLTASATLVGYTGRLYIEYLRVG